MAREQKIHPALQDYPELRSFILHNVRATGRVLVNGAYGSVEELEKDGLVCTGKKIYDILIDHRITGRYYNECRLIADLRHIHIVQLLGICFFPDYPLPVQVMEETEIHLHELLEKIPDITLEAKITILKDVAKGLVYLHNHSPPVIHRDLTAKSILLNSRMIAKIGNFFSSRTMPEYAETTMTHVPGTLLYMPPEALDEPSRYSLSLDMFSFGHLTLYVALQEFPRDLLEPTYVNHLDGKLRARTENERRGKYFARLEAVLDHKHPLVLLAKECLHNMPKKRPSARVALGRLGSVIESSSGLIGRLHLLESLLGVEEKRGKENPTLQMTLFAALRPYTKNVQETGKQLGYGAHGSVVEVKMGEKIFAAKSFREMSLTNIQSFVDTFCSRVILLLKLSHPNILKYEGICYLSGEQKTPSLLMERMTCSLRSYLLQHENKNLPINEKASILCNVANGLRYLHGQSPAIIHRDLTATNVLLDSRLVAKIADFGNARIVDLNPLSTPQTMTANPGTINYMPPEVWDKSSEYAAKLDTYSFGHLSLFTVVQERINVLASTYMDNEVLCARSEIERRGEYMKKAEQMLGERHVLVVMIEKCLNVDAARQPSAKQLFSALENFVATLLDNQIKMEDLHEVTTYLMDLSKDQIFSLGLALGLINCTLSEYEDSSVQRYLSHMLKAWLREQDNVDRKSGPPTWKSLVKALRAGTVRQTGIANKIEKDKLQQSQ